MIDLIAHNFPDCPKDDAGSPVPETKVLDHGFVRLVDSMPRISYDPNVTTCDAAIVQAARVSYGTGTKKVSEDRGLVRYLLRHRHTTPAEMVEFKFHCAMPMFIARQWIRHRTANVNEYSARYSVVKDRFYLPDASNVRLQSNKNKQVSEGQANEGDAQWFLDRLSQTCEQAYQDYEEACSRNVGREQARMILPVNCYTEWYWKCDLHNLLHFLALRCDSHAQQEIQDYGNAILNMIKPLVPWAIEAWEDYHPMRGAVLLTRLEADAIRDASDLQTDNKREKDEWVVKAKRLGLEQ